MSRPGSRRPLPVPAGDGRRSENAERRRLEEHGIRPHKRLGQNFLLDPAVPREVVRRAAWGECDPVIEIGPGAGALTAELLRSGRRVIALEIDRTLLGLLEDRFAPELAEGRLRVVGGDALEADLPALAASLGAAGPARPWLAGNLPYGITTPLLFAGLRAASSLAGAVVMVQREYGERLLARPGGREYSSLTVRAAATATARSLLRVGRSVFWPRPGVESIVIELRFPEPPPFTGDLARLEAILRAAFGQRRKTLENSLAHGCGLDKGEARAWLTAAGCDPGARAETLDLARFAALEAAMPPAAARRAALGGYGGLGVDGDETDRPCADGQEEREPGSAGES